MQMEVTNRNGTIVASTELEPSVVGNPRVGTQSRVACVDMEEDVVDIEIEFNEEESSPKTDVPEWTSGFTHVGVPEWAPIAGVPEWTPPVGVPERTPTVDAPDGAFTAGVPEGAPAVGVPEGASTQGVPERTPRLESPAWQQQEERENGDYSQPRSAPLGYLDETEFDDEHYGNWLEFTPDTYCAGGSVATTNQLEKPKPPTVEGSAAPRPRLAAPPRAPDDKGADEAPSRTSASTTGR